MSLKEELQQLSACDAYVEAEFAALTEAMRAVARVGGTSYAYWGPLSRSVENSRIRELVIAKLQKEDLHVKLMHDGGDPREPNDHARHWFFISWAE